MASKPPDGLKHGRMLRCQGYDVTTVGGCCGDASQGKIAGLRGAGDEDDFVLVGPDQIRDLSSSELDSISGVPSEAMTSGMRISEELGPIRSHRLPDPWVHRGSSLIIEIDWQIRHGYTSYSVQSHGRIVSSNRANPPRLPVSSARISYEKPLDAPKNPMKFLAF